MRKKTRLALVGAALALAGSGISIPFAGPASASGASVTIVNSSGSLANGGTVTLTGTGFPAHSADPTGLEIIECSDPGGSPSNLPFDPAQGCDGNTVSSNQINTDASGNFHSTYTLSKLASPGTSNINCDASSDCVLWVGVDYNNDFSNPSTRAFSAPFTIVSPTFTSAASAVFPTFTTTTFTVMTTGTTEPANPSPTITETGALPSGVTFHDNGNGTATLTGKPSAIGSFPLTFKSFNGGAPDATQSFSLSSGFRVITTSLPAAKIGSSYSSGPISVLGGTAPFKFKVTGLPKGLKASKTTGLISGTPAVSKKVKPGVFTLTVTVTDSKVKTSTKHPNPSAHGKETATATLHLTLTS
jgi:hypothetical protein